MCTDTHILTQILYAMYIVPEHTNTCIVKPEVKTGLVILWPNCKLLFSFVENNFVTQADFLIFCCLHTDVLKSKSQTLKS